MTGKNANTFTRFDLSRANSIPAELRAPHVTGDATIHHWVCWRIEQRDGRDTKVPIDAKTGSMASSTDTSTWSTFDTAIQSYQNNPDYAGIGRTFLKDENIVGIDFDDCLDKNGKIKTELALKWVKAFNSYTEVSPSGTGIKLWIRAKKPGKECRNNKLGVEVYSEGRYFTVTGVCCHQVSRAVEQRQEVLNEFWKEVFGKKEQPEQPNNPIYHNPLNNGFTGDDKALLAKAANAENGHKFKNLWEGKYEEEGFQSNSEARMSILQMLAFWTGGNEERMAQLFQRSKLYEEREEKLEHVRGCGSTFLQEQIRTALEQWEANGSECYHAVETNGLPIVLLPFGSVTISECAKELAEYLANNGMAYRRGGIPVRVTISENQDAFLEEITPAKACSIFEKVARLCSYSKKGELSPTVASIEIARKLIESDDFLSRLPPIKIITSCPVLIPNSAGELMEVTGYDGASGIYAQGKPTIPCSLDEARRLIEELVSDFDFVSPCDKSRAMAAIISPALAMGGLINGRIPVDLCEADDSQAGKGYRNRITACVYGEKISVVNATKGSIGGFDEALDSALMRGRPFISLDNIRGKINSQKLESLLTESNYQARSAYKAFAEIHPSNYILLMTSNKAELTVDLANRCSMVRIRKRPSNYAFRTYPTGDILDHVDINQSKYLGAVFAVVREWWQRGKQESKEVAHDFRKWARVLDWIMRNVMTQQVFLEDHRQLQVRVTSPAQNWLRDIALILPYNDEGCTGELRTNELLKAIETYGEIDVPGLGEYDDLENEDVRGRVLRAMGKRLSQCFTKNVDHINLGGIRVLRIAKKERPAGESSGERDVRFYQFTRLSKTCTHENPCKTQSAPIAPNDPNIFK